MDLGEIAAKIVEDNRYLTLGTVDAAGRPWTSPVFYAAAPDHRSFYWVSMPDAAHSVNLAARPELSAVIFNSQVRPGSGQAVYLSGTAAPVPGPELGAALEIYPGPPERLARPITPDDLPPTGVWTLYRATMSRRWLLCPRQPGQPCEPHGRANDHRVEIGF